MARIALPGRASGTAAGPRLSGGLRALVPLLLVAGCASWHSVPPEVTPAGVAERVLIPPDLNVNPPETVVKPGPPGPASAGPSAPPSYEVPPATFALPDAIAFALQNNPRLR